MGTLIVDTIYPDKKINNDLIIDSDLTVTRTVLAADARVKNRDFLNEIDQLASRIQSLEASLSAHVNKKEKFSFWRDGSKIYYYAPIDGKKKELDLEDGTSQKRNTFIAYNPGRVPNPDNPHDVGVDAELFFNITGAPSLENNTWAATLLSNEDDWSTYGLYWSTDMGNNVYWIENGVSVNVWNGQPLSEEKKEEWVSTFRLKCKGIYDFVIHNAASYYIYCP